MTTRVSRRKERAARRRSLRVQRGGATASINQLNTLEEFALKEINKKLGASEQRTELTPDEKTKIANAVIAVRGTFIMNDLKTSDFINQALQAQEVGIPASTAAGGAAAGPNNNGQEEGAVSAPEEGATLTTPAAGGDAAAPKEGEVPPAIAPATAAPWHKIPEERKADWEAAVSASDISNILLPVIQTGEITPLAYIELLARQNDLFKMAFDIIRDKLKKVIEDKIKLKEDKTEQEKDLEELKEGMTDPFILVKYSEEIKATSGELMNYIDDVEKLIIKSTEGGDTKLGSIRSQQEDIFELLLFPDRLQNLLIKSVANLCIMLVKDENYALVKKPELSSILLKQYSSYAESLARSQTAIGTRDGYYLSQDIKKLEATNLINLSMGDHVKDSSNESLSAFWKDFISTLNKATDDTMLFSIKTVACERYINKMSWGEIAANIFLQYKRGDFKEEEPYYAPILTLFSGKCNQKPEALTPEYPNESIWKLPIYNTITLENAFDHVAPITLEFMLHLAYEITRATPPTSSVQAQPNSQGSEE
jgi:hypothetical protein